MGTALGVLIIMGCFLSSIRSHKSLRAILLFILVSINSPLSFAEKPLTTVADLRYGVALYEYFQSNHFESLSELMVAKERGGIQGHKDNPELIEGSLNLAYGMDRQAGAIYNRLLDDAKPLEVRNAAWFYLSKIRYQRGEYEEVRASLANIEKPISSDLIDEMEAMEIQLLIKKSQFEEAEQRLAKASARTRSGRQFQYWRPYLNFNIGAVYARYEKMDTAQTFFSKVISERLSKNSNFHTEQLALYDKAFIASAYSYFQQENYKKAIDEFGQVRQATPLANDALLGYGWAKAKLGDYKAALAPWTILSQRPLADEAVQEALIAIPNAYLQLGDINRALDSYARAEDIYIKELAHIDRAGEEVLGKSIVELFQLEDSEANYSWLVPEHNSLVKTPSRYLLPLYTLNRFQNSVQTLVDLYRIRKKLEAWQENLDAYADLMDYRLTTFRRQQQPAEYGRMSSELLELKTQRDEMAAVLNEAKQQKDVFMLLDEDRQDLLEMVQSGERNAKVLSAAGESTEEESEWLQRYRGLLLWSATLDFDERIWQVESELNAVAKTLASASNANDKIKVLLTDAPDISSAQERISGYAVKVNALLTNNNDVMASIEADVRAQIFTALALQRQRVQFYLGEARLAVAQLYDNKYLEGAKQ